MEQNSDDIDEGEEVTVFKCEYCRRTTSSIPAQISHQKGRHTAELILDQMSPGVTLPVVKQAIKSFVTKFKETRGPSKSVSICPMCFTQVKGTPIRLRLHVMELHPTTFISDIKEIIETQTAQKLAQDMVTEDLNIDNQDPDVIPLNSDDDDNIKIISPFRPAIINCSECSTSFLTHVAFNAHFRKYHAASSSLTANKRCIVCSKTFGSVSDFNVHLMKKHPPRESKEKCLYCKYVAYDSNDMFTHKIERHLEELVYEKMSQCGNVPKDKCDKAVGFRFKEMISGKIHTCFQCGQRLQKRSQLRRHVGKFHLEEFFKAVRSRLI